MIEYSKWYSHTIALKSFVRPICEYGNVAIMGAAASYLCKLDAVQKKAEKLSDFTFPSLHSRREASAVGLLFKLVGGLYNSFVQLLPPLHWHILTL